MYGNAFISHHRAAPTDGGLRAPEALPAGHGAGQRCVADRRRPAGDRCGRPVDQRQAGAVAAVAARLRRTAAVHHVAAQSGRGAHHDGDDDDDDDATAVAAGQGW